MDIHGKYGLVTGGAEGIGKVLVENLLQKGAKGVAILDVNESKGEETRKELEKRFENQQILFLNCDVSSKDQMKVAFQEIINSFGQLHIVCNNAAIVNEVNWERMFQVNLNGTIYGTLLAIEHMEASTGGVVINMSSAASLTGSGMLPVHCYSTTKCAMNAFTRNVALSDPVAKKKRIRINIVCPLRVIDKPPPSSTKSESRVTADPTMHKTLMEADPMTKEAAKIKTGKHSRFTKGICTMQDVANTTLMLIEDDYNGETAMPLEGKPTVVEDCHRRFREEVLKYDIMKTIDQL